MGMKQGKQLGPVNQIYTRRSVGGSLSKLHAAHAIEGKYSENLLNTSKVNGVFSSSVMSPVRFLG